VRVAAVDIGTNTVRLLVADVTAAGEVTWLRRSAVVTRLGQGVDRTGGFAPEAVERTIAALAGLGEEARSAGCRIARAVATSATRDASDRETFLDRAEAALGFRPEVIDGDEEAALAFAGATTGAAGARPFLVIDPGGGSTEFVLGEDHPVYAVSVDIGSVRLTERLLPRHPATGDDVATAARHVDDLLAAAVMLPRRPGTVIGVAGTFTNLASLHLDLPAYDPDAVHGTVLGADDLATLVARLATMTVAEVAALPAIDPGRAPVLLGGAIVAEQSLAHVGADRIRVSERDNLDGIAASLGISRAG
jgi:exopolyphosphatase/guanosine-5'-triphosphate,3'-diphosphate pyrophosphatase